MLGFALNHTNLYKINVTPHDEVKTMARIAAGINSAEWAGNETIAQDAYYDSDGATTSEVTGGQLIGTFSGHRYFGDPAQDYIAGLLLSRGEDRKTECEWIAPNGDIIEGVVTIANISPQSGDPNSKSDFSFELHMNGYPVFTPGDSATFPDAVSCNAITVNVGGSAVAAATVTPATAAQALAYDIEDDTIATVDANGTVKGIKAGKTRLVVKSMVKPGVKAVAEVTVGTGK